MSRKEDLRYVLMQQRRREEFESRVRSTTAGFLGRYRRILDDVRAEGLVAYAPHEYHQARSIVDQIDSLVGRDPEGARDLSIRHANAIHALPRVARAARLHAREQEWEGERQKAAATERAQEELETIWRENLSVWEDALARQLAFKDLAGLRAGLMAPGSGTTAAELRSALDELRHRHEQQAARLREREAEAAREEAAREALAACRQGVEEARAAAPDAARVVEEALARAEDLPPDEMQRCLAEATSALDDAVVNEVCRREVVQAVYRSLEDAGFVVDRPRRQLGQDLDEVVIRARRPSGAEASFRVDLNGGMNFEFAGYKGLACKKDVDVVLPQLEAIYGIKLSDRRVIWSNPDDRDQDARPQPTMNQETGNGR